MIEFFVPGIPIAQGSKVAFTHRGTGRAMMKESNRDKLIPWRAAIAAQAELHKTELLTGPVSVQLLFQFSRPKSHYGTGKNAGILKPSAPMHKTSKPDIDKLTRAVLDALTGVVLADDSQVIDVRSLKVFVDSSGARPGVFVSIDECLPKSTIEGS